MKIQSNWLDKLVKVAGRNLTEKPEKGKVYLDIGEVVELDGEDFVITSWNISMGFDTQVANIELKKIINGKVVK